MTLKYIEITLDSQQVESLLADFENEGCDFANTCLMYRDRSVDVDESVLEQEDIPDGFYWFEDDDSMFQWAYYSDGERVAGEASDF